MAGDAAFVLDDRAMSHDLIPRLFRMTRMADGVFRLPQMALTAWFAFGFVHPVMNPELSRIGEVTAETELLAGNTKQFRF